MRLFKNKYRIESARLKGWDYSSPGWYFVTICTKGMVRYFGEISNGQMQRNQIGDIVAQEWERTPCVRKNVELDEWIVMPNHLHGIIILREKPAEERTLQVETTRSVGTTQRVVSTTLKPNSLGSIIGQFKSITARRIHSAGYPDFAWQPRYYDHIIRNERSLKKIREYIVANVAQWELDKNNSSDFVNWI